MVELNSCVDNIEKIVRNKSNGELEWMLIKNCEACKILKCPYDGVVTIHYCKSKTVYNHYLNKEQLSLPFEKK